MNQEIYEAVREIIQKITEKHFAPITIGYRGDLAKSIAEAVPEKEKDSGINHSVDLIRMGHNAFHNTLLKNLRKKK